MYTYEIIRVLENNKITFSDLYKNYYSKKEQNMIKQMDEGRCKYYAAAKFEDQIIGCMGINEREKDFYALLHIVVHSDHRGKGVATDLVRNSLILLANMGATKIRAYILSATRDIIKHSFLIDDLGFIEVPYPNDEPPISPPDPGSKVYEFYIGGE